MTSEKKPTLRIAANTPTKAPAKPPKKQFKYPVRSTATSSKSTPIVVPTPPKAPNVLYTAKVWDTIQFLIDYNDEEVGWLGTVDRLPNGDLLIDEIFVPKQKVHGAETEIDTEAYHALCHLLLESDRYADAEGNPRLIYWGHSHVDMNVSPSGQDEEQVAEYLEETPLFIRGIYNKKGASKVDVYDVTQNVVHQCVEEKIRYNGLSQEELAALKRLVDDNVISAPLPQLGNWGLGNKKLYGDDWNLDPRTIFDTCPRNWTQHYTPIWSREEEFEMAQELLLMGVDVTQEEVDTYIEDQDDPRLNDLMDTEIIYYGVTMGDDWLDQIMPWTEPATAIN